MNKYKLAAILIVSVFAISSCAPRGESKTLDEVYQLAKARYMKAQNNGAPDKVQPVLKQVVDGLAAGHDGSSVDAKVIAEGLDELTTFASYTNRPAFAELAAQYRTITAMKDAPNADGVKLLVSRTYSLIASELETMKFKL